MKAQEIIEAVERINQEMFNNTGNEYMFLTYTTNGFSDAVEFMGVRVWDDNDNDQEYNEDTDEYEPIEACLRRLLKLEIQKMSELLP